LEEESRSPWTCGKQIVKGEKQSFRREQEMNGEMQEMNFRREQEIG
jgi:hypothetical protein